MSAATRQACTRLLHALLGLSNYWPAIGNEIGLLRHHLSGTLNMSLDNPGYVPVNQDLGPL